MEVFLIKWGMGTLCFLENGSFLTKYRHESSDFLLKIGKKWYHIDFFGPSKQVEKMLDITGIRRKTHFLQNASFQIILFR